METPNTTQVSTIVGREDRYHGIIVDPDSLPSTLDSFMIHMEAALEAWRATRKRGIWLKIPIEKASFIGPAVDTFNFKFHHAEEDFVMCLKWLPKEPGNIPPNASHQVGVGAFVMNDRGQVLAVQEKNGPLKGMGVWKMPTGVVNAGEDIGEGAEREVMEETGICASFDSVLCIRQAHGVAFGKSDMFFVCGMKAHPGQETFMPQASEIEAVQWMDLDEITRQEFVQGRPVIRETFEACRLYMAGEYRGLVGGRIQDGVRRTPYFFLRGRASNEDPSAKL
ncbi:unnamed protein product [Ostreobium quekettii]|uniref:Nudix hydrolase domain-containing protein n=1 Tax=Ostreobium quekettii TaxID=121088 RepID=A0A8S1JHN9_9CHLO|nr:unnamed protein product [Ostreobium quekettii]